MLAFLSSGPGCLSSCPPKLRGNKNRRRKSENSGSREDSSFPVLLTSLDHSEKNKKTSQERTQSSISLKEEEGRKMGTTLFSSYCLSLRNPHSHLMHAKSSLYDGIAGSCVAATRAFGSTAVEDGEGATGILGRTRRRTAVVSGLSLASGLVLGFPKDGLAVKQGPLAGRIPGLSEPDERGWRTYRRPDEKSGGHGVGWSPIIPYTFSVPQGWEEVPVSIADLGGTEIDLRFASSQEGRLFVIVAPVLRFADLPGDATIEQIGPPEKVINAFGPEVIGENVEGKVLNMEVEEHSGRTYYQFELEPPHVLITATAAGNRLYLFNVTAKGLQWKRHYKELKQIADSFRVI